MKASKLESLLTNIQQKTWLEN